MSQRNAFFSFFLTSNNIPGGPFQLDRVFLPEKPPGDPGVMDTSDGRSVPCLEKVGEKLSQARCRHFSAGGEVWFLDSTALFRQLFKANRTTGLIQNVLE